MNKLPILIMATACLVLAGGPAFAAGRADVGKAKSEDCGDCHGQDGAGDGDTIPAIAGMPVEKFKQAIADYRSGKRKVSQMMTKQSHKLSDQDVADLAAYYASLAT